MRCGDVAKVIQLKHKPSCLYIETHMPQVYMCNNFMNIILFVYIYFMNLLNFIMILYSQYRNNRDLNKSELSKEKIKQL